MRGSAVDLASVLESVTVYRRHAVCARRARVPDGAPARVRFTGLPAALDAGSVRVHVVERPASLRVLDVRAVLDARPVTEADVPAEVRALEAARAEADAVRARLARVEADVAELQGLRPQPPEPRRGDPPREAPVAAMLALGDFVGERLAARLSERRELRRRLGDAEREVALRERRVAEASTAAGPERLRVERAVVATLSAPPGAGQELIVEYLVSGVRWAPAYDLRLAPGMVAGTLAMRAAVAQATGEDWTGVRLTLSTASPARVADVPELRSQRIGRSQPPPPRSGWREPPPGLDDLFEAYDAAVRERPRPPTPAAASGGARAKAGRGRAPSEAPPPSMPPAPPAAAPATPTPFAEAILGGAAPPMRRMRAAAPAQRAVAEEVAAPPPEEPPPPAPPLPDAALLDYGALTLAAPDEGPRRGRLHAAPAALAGVAVSVEVRVVAVAIAAARARAEEIVGAAPPPPGCREAAPVEHFDYAFDCAAPVDVPATGRWVTVPVTTCAVAFAPAHVCVPAVDEHVFRVLRLRNTSPHALLPGPVDVSIGDQFLLTAQLPATPPGADEGELGLGVEEAIKVVRRTHFRETTTGLLAGTTSLPHEVEIDLDNRLASPAEIELRERVPVPADGQKDLEVQDVRGKTPWEAVTTPVDGAVVPGLRRARITLAPGQRATVALAYTVRLPADKALVGGNRRD